MSETGLLPAYLIVGTDGVKRDHAVSRMKARLEKSGMVEFNLDERFALAHEYIDFFKCCLEFSVVECRDNSRQSKSLGYRAQFA